MAGIVIITSPPPEIALALMMFACAPPLASTTNIALMIGLDAAICLNVTIIGAVLLPFIAPPILTMTSGFDVNLDAWIIFTKLLFIVGGALIVGSILRYSLGVKRIQRHGNTFDGLTTLMLLAFLMAVMGPGGKILLSDPMLALRVCAIALAVNFLSNILFAIGSEYLSSGKLRKPQRISASIGLIAGNRNFALMVPALPDEIFAGVVVFLAFYQVPIYLTPLLERWVFRELR
jgi:predicted Na+-dependent transporter